VPLSPRASTKRALIIAGPNGAGKTTFAREFLPVEAGLPIFVNADLIAAGISPFDPDRAALQAGRVMAQAIRGHVARGESFAFETTLAGRRYARAIPRWQAARYRVSLIFLALPSPEIAIARVAERVRQGGHSVPEEVIRRRFRAGWSNFERVYKALVDEWWLYDSSGLRPELMDRGAKP
jgi:predicted ABC-type ATPase